MSDAAYDEVKAARLLRGNGGDFAELKNLRILTRDKPHASRRNLSRGWATDAFLNEVSERFIFGQKSPARLIEYSPMFSAVFQQRVQQLEDSLRAVKSHPKLGDLRFAPHRFESGRKFRVFKSFINESYNKLHRANFTSGRQRRTRAQGLVGVRVSSFIHFY